jgi:sugar phosphate isomerase/epimerase
MNERLGLNIHRDATVDPLRLDLHLPPGRGSLPWSRLAPAVAEHRAPLMLEIEPSQRLGREALAWGVERLFAGEGFVAT